MADQSNGFWQGRRVCVTGGAGFLGAHLLAVLRGRGAKDIFVPQIEEYDLVRPEAIQRMLGDARPDIILHLAARVGGIGPTGRTRPSSSTTT